MRGCAEETCFSIINPEGMKSVDQVKIGKFISEQRKQEKYTQRQLADILGISDKTVSKWECGNGFPEVSLLLPLCNELKISVNELLSGEKLSEVDYKKKAEENMVNIIQEKEDNKKKMQLTVLIGVIAIISFVTILLVVCMYTDVMSISVKLILIAIACLIFGIGMYAAMQGERTIGYFKCKECEDVFIPDFMAYTMGIHILSTRRLKCPHCGKKSWCRKILAKE